MAQQNEAPQDDGRKHRRMKNFLLDARFQLKITAYIVMVTLLVAGLLFVFLSSTTGRLFTQMQVAVDAQGKAAQTSKELGVCTLNNDIAANMKNAAFDKQLKERSEAIDKKYEDDRVALEKARSELVAQQKITLWALVGGLIAFIAFVALGTIVVTHGVVGPLFRIKRIADEVAQGRLHPPTYGLRPGDELQDVFEKFNQMVIGLRKRQEENLKQVEAALAGGDAVATLEALRKDIKSRLE
jgi:HAMP domain-containing protein